MEWFLQPLRHPWGSATGLGQVWAEGTTRRAFSLDWAQAFHHLFPQWPR